MAILMRDIILTIFWWIAVLLSMPTIVSFAGNTIIEHVILTLGVLVLLLIPLAFTKL